MNLEEALKALKEGKKIRHRFWIKDVYLYCDDNGYFIVIDDKGNASLFEFRVNCLNYAESNQWELYEEPTL